MEITHLTLDGCGILLDDIQNRPTWKKIRSRRVKDQDVNGFRKKQSKTKTPKPKPHNQKPVVNT